MDGRVDLSKVKLNYAGRDFEQLMEIAQKLDMVDILDNHGYVSRAEAARLQTSADLFLVLSWNRHDSQGVLPAKIYEGIRAKKPILSLVSGDLPGSELSILNDRFHYGFCYEEARDQECFEGLCEFLAKAYDEKMNCGKVQYQIAPAFEEHFRYDNLAEQLERFMEQL